VPYKLPRCKSFIGMHECVKLSKKYDNIIWSTDNMFSVCGTFVPVRKTKTFPQKLLNLNIYRYSSSVSLDFFKKLMWCVQLKLVYCISWFGVIWAAGGDSAIRTRTSNHCQNSLVKQPENFAIKGTLTRDFRPLVFFIKQLPLGPWDTG
jgi:hypothetical protein